MDVEYTGRQTTITKKLKLQAEAGLARIAKIVGNSASVHVILSTDKYRQTAEVTVQTRHHKLVARCEATEMVIALRDALVKIQGEGGPKRKLVGLEMIERGIGRDGYPVFGLNGQRIGEITSGSPSPFLKKNIALAYVPVESGALDTEVAVEIRGQMVKAKVVPTPFYKRAKKCT